MEFLRRDLNGCIHIEEAWPIIKKSIHALGVPLKIEKLLTNVSERVGQQICTFMAQSVLNLSNAKNFNNNWFSNYTDADLNNLSKDLQWTLGGEISIEKTLMLFMVNHPQASPLLFFLSACEAGDENLILQVWNNLKRDQITRIESNLSWTEDDVFTAYWVCFCQNRLDVYFRTYEGKDFVISSRGSMYFYLVTHSMRTCFKSRTQYFYSKLDKAEKEKFVQVIDINGKYPILLGRIKYSFKLFEAPILNHDVNKLILENLSEDEFEYFVDYLLSEINDFSELHTNVLMYVMSMASDDVKLWTLKDPDFYFFLISRGRFSIIEMLLNNDIKHVLKEEITAGLNSAEASPSLETALASKYSYNLYEFIELIAEADKDITNTFQERFKSTYCINEH